MSNVLENAPEKRRRGRPRKVVAPVVSTSVEPNKEACEAAMQRKSYDALLEYDMGDVGAQMASKSRLQRPSNFLTSNTYLPDLNHPGTIVNIHNPSWQFQRSWLEEDGSRYARQTALQMKMRGWKPAMADEFLICPELRDAIVPDDSGRLVFADMSGKGGCVIMVRDKARLVEANKELLQYSDAVQQTAEEKAALLQESLRSQGMEGVRVKTTITDDE